MAGTHATLSPSGADRWMKCPGSVAAEQQYPDTSNEYARLGTAAHSLAEQCLSTGNTPWQHIGEVITVEEADCSEAITIDRDMAHFVDLYMSQVQEANSDASVAYAEMRTPIDHLTGEDDATGTSDYVGVAFRLGGATIRVHDLKYGQGVRVEAEGNYQLVMYASGVVRELDFLIDDLDEEDVTVEIYVHQVRLDHLPFWRLSLADLRGYEEVVRARADQCTPDAPRIPGEDQCRFCKARTGCPELHALVAETTSEEPPQDAEAVAQVMPRLKMIRDWAATVEARAIELLEHDDPVMRQYFKLVEGRKQKVWNVDENKLARVLKYNTDLGQKDLYTKKLISPAQAEKAVPKSELDRVRKYIEMKEGKPTIAPVDDKRPAVNSAEAMGFSDLTDSD